MRREICQTLSRADLESVNMGLMQALVDARMGRITHGEKMEVYRSLSPTEEGTRQIRLADRVARRLTAK